MVATSLCCFAQMVGVKVDGYQQYFKPSITITNSFFVNNTGAPAAGVYSYAASSVSVTNTVFRRNTASRAGAIYMLGGWRTTLVVRDCTFTDNCVGAAATCSTTAGTSAIRCHYASPPGNRAGKQSFQSGC